MARLRGFLSFALTLLWVSKESDSFPRSPPTFSIDYENNQFVRDGEPFRYVSGSLHYFRVPSELWWDRMVKMRASGVNALETYIEWNSHEPESGSYDFDGDNDVVKFIKMAQKADLLVILRPGPYIDAERDMGGLPYWLLKENPRMTLRSSAPTFLRFVDRWYSVVFPKIRPLIYSNGGPVIMAQVENEYGSYSACDFTYTAHLRDLTRKYLGNEVILFTTDGAGDGYLKCGKIDDVYTTVDFGTGTDPSTAFAIQRTHQRKGPLINSEFYPGWLDHWAEPHNTVSTDAVTSSLEKMLSLNASVNIYLFHGGTSYGFEAGSNFDGTNFKPNPTSYDYDAPLNEAGDPTDKYFAIRDVIGKYLPMPEIPLPVVSPKMSLGPIQLRKVGSLFALLDFIDADVSEYPLTFEDLSVRHGFVLYSTQIDAQPSDPAVLSIPGLRDRAQVYVDSTFQGTLSRTEKITSLPLNAKKGSSLKILVENQGRICYGSDINELKGITSNVTLGPTVVTNWTHYPIFKDWDQAMDGVYLDSKDDFLPAFYSGNFSLSSSSKPLDTFLELKGWKKGVAFLNGFNLGRYWPFVGPQLTLYVPKHLFKPYPQTNTIVLMEQEDAPCVGHEHCPVSFVQNHVINGTTPFNDLKVMRTVIMKEHIITALP